uniref:UspA domain-containing protein n=1 Tax=Thermogemmatispora argillosa TaxID=2045280 RepID=A0A455T8I5_9CHLR|nr:hypothetical protein KTA_39720 [Thermogemmatispora argillosa]
MTRRWLLPFSWGIDVQAIDAIVRLAALEGASLIALSLLPGPKTRKLRAEYWQQSQDFLEVVRWKSQRYGVRGTAYELLTEDIGQSIVSFAHEFACDRVLVIRRPHGDALLPATQVQQLLRERLVPLMLFYLPESAEYVSLGRRLQDWLRVHWPRPATHIGGTR